MRVFTEELETSRNTITRDFEFLRDSLGAPLEYCREHNGHRYNPQAPVFELPGFWMNPAELYALLACEHLLENVQPGLLTSRLAPLKEKVRRLLGESGHDAEEVSERIRIQPIQTRTTSHQTFDPVAQATLSGKCLRFHYQARSGSGHKHRTVDPQRLLHYRSNWYLLALCRQAEALRLFSLDRIIAPDIQPTPARQMSPEQLDAFASSDSRELIMEVLRYGADVEVLGPEDLRAEVCLPHSRGGVSSDPSDVMYGHMSVRGQLK